MSAEYSKSESQGFAVHSLENNEVRVSMVPELGGRIVSIRDKTVGREWLDGWEPESARRLWKPTDPADFETGPGAGIDECLPTVLPCEVDGKLLPDHGELWYAEAPFDDGQGKRGAMLCRWQLVTLPLCFEREISLEQNRIRIRYRLENMADTVTPFLWAWHPLFTFEEGDQIRFADPLTGCRSPEGDELPWPEALPGQDLSRAEMGGVSPAAAKVFLGPVDKAQAEIRGLSSSLSLDWTGEYFPWVGIWITRGAWKGLHHWAIEPTNCPVDRCSDTPANDSLTSLRPSEVRNWEISLGLARH